MKNNCNTIGGPTNWTEDWKCQFPFQYDGHIYSECVDTVVNGQTISWCSTRVTKSSRKHVNGYWAECSQDCKCRTINGPKDWTSGENCQFPFEYSGKEYNGCIEYDLPKNRDNPTFEKNMWCSTKVHATNRSHIHGHWAQCSKECPAEKRYNSKNTEKLTTLQDSSNNCGKCKFPFIMKVGGTTQNGCILRGKDDHRKSLWCPTQLDNDMLPREDCWEPCSNNCNNEYVAGKSNIT